MCVRQRERREREAGNRLGQRKGKPKEESQEIHVPLTAVTLDL